MAPEPGFITLPADVLVKALKAIAGIRQKFGSLGPPIRRFPATPSQVSRLDFVLKLGHESAATAGIASTKPFLRPR
jgi:hypothetical protein